MVYSALRVMGVARCPGPHPRQTMSTVFWIKSRAACVKDLEQRGTSVHVYVGTCIYSASQLTFMHNYNGIAVVLPAKQKVGSHVKRVLVQAD